MAEPGKCEEENYLDGTNRDSRGAGFSHVRLMPGPEHVLLNEARGWLKPLPGKPAKAGWRQHWGLAVHQLKLVANGGRLKPSE
ncbi:MAG: hypothetical protein ACKV0T_31460 [Planctomycetales bacterium]